MNVQSPIVLTEPYRFAGFCHQTDFHVQQIERERIGAAESAHGQGRDTFDGFPAPRKVERDVIVNDLKRRLLGSECRRRKPQSNRCGECLRRSPDSLSPEQFAEHPRGRRRTSALRSGGEFLGEFNSGRVAIIGVA